MVDSIVRRWFLVATLAALLLPVAGRAGETPTSWNKETAAAYLDQRAKTWYDFGSAFRGAGETRTTCVSCHTVVPYAFARPLLKGAAGTDQATEYQDKLLAQTKRRVETWKDLDTRPIGLMYDFNEQKKKESWGTEAVLDTLVLALDDRQQGRSSPSETTRKALANLWQVQAQDGPEKGSWDWLNFGLEPWESPGARYYGTSLAAIALGTVPGYHVPGADAAVDARIKLLRGYLKDQLGGQNLFNRTWALWVSTRLEGILSAEEQKAVAAQLLAVQQADGGWSLPSLGKFVRGDNTPQDTTSDGYATGLVLHVLQLAGITKEDAAIAKGLDWLRANQAATGEWRCNSVNKKRDPATHVGKFMTDAATGFAVLALSH